MTRLDPTRHRGQALVETALVIPVVILLCLGAYDVSTFASNHVQAQTAVRNGSRTGALLGGKGGADQTKCKGAVPSTFIPADTELIPDLDGDQDAIDSAIVQTVLRGTANMSYVTVQEIDIYSPTQANGVYKAGDPVDRYDASGKEIKTAGVDIQTFNITDKRCQGPLGSESELGVRMTWTYKPVNRIIGTSIANLTDFAVEKLAYCDTGCHQ